MSDREHSHLVLRDNEPVQRYVSRLTEGNDEFANIAVYATPEQRVGGQDLDGRTYGSGCPDGRVRVLAGQEVEGALQVRE